VDRKRGSCVSTKAINEVLIHYIAYLIHDITQLGQQKNRFLLLTLTLSNGLSFN
jgi:hypothetical protein